MIYWLISAVLAYLFFSFSSLGDKLVLAGKEQGAVRPKAYTFYVGLFGLFVFLIIPFIDFNIPQSKEFIWIILSAVVRVFGLYTMYVAIEKFDVSRVVATIGATQPIFIFILTWLFWGPQTMPLMSIIAFIILFAGSVLISIDKNINITGGYLKITIFSSAMFSLDYIFSKLVYLGQPFLQGIILIQGFMFLFMLVFLINKKSREEIFSKQTVLGKKNRVIFLGSQVCGGVGNILQSFAISLAPVVFLATVNSLRGIQYAFLFILTMFISFFYPKILKEGVSKKQVFQKVISIILIIIGLALLAI